MTGGLRLAGCRALAVLAMTAGLAGCSTTPPRPAAGDKPTAGASRDTNAGRYAMAQDVAPGAEEVPPDIHAIPDAVPRPEPRSAGGNAPVYQVFGKTYRTLDSATGFRERGHASWYGKKFHGHKTASGERYDMYQMTAAHKSLPLPSYVRVTRLDNGRSIIVRVNDRGPFHPGRVIDLSYAGAARLGMLAEGSAAVEIVALDPMQPASADERWLQVAAYEDPINAVVMREQLRRLGLGEIQVLVSDEDGAVWHRVVLGPFRDAGSAEDTRSRLRNQGYDASPLRAACSATGPVRQGLLTLARSPGEC